jgi:hypothetical protein
MPERYHRAGAQNSSGRSDKYNRAMRFAVVALSVLVFACSAPFRCVTPQIALPTLPRLGEVLPDPGPTCTHTLVSPSQTWPSYDTVLDGVTYTVGVDDEHRVHSVATSDELFRTPEGLKVGDAPPAGPVVLERVWGSFVRLPSGWHAFIGDGQRVTMFFLRE